MKRFHFSLEALLKMRKMEEKIVYEDFISSSKKVEEAIAELGKLQLEYDDIEKECRNRQANCEKLTVIRDYFFYLQNLQDKIANKQDLIFFLKNDLGEKRQVFIEAQQNTKAIDLIKEKKYLQWQEKYKKEEIKILDEIANVKYLKYKGENEER